MRRSGVVFTIGLLALVLALPPAFADASRNTAVPGTVNYVEGEVSIGSHSLDSKSVGSIELQAGQSITTNQGKTEVLLTPGVFLRLGNHSSAQMISPRLTDTEVTLNEGEALMEVDEIHPQNDIRVVQDGATTRLLKTGLYDFDATHKLVRVIDGKAGVRENDHNVTVKAGHELALNTGARVKPQKFDKNDFEAGDLYRWSSLRSDYLAEANIDTARIYYANGWYGPGWLGAGWYWDPWFSSFTFIPSDGIFYNPFGWGFYSPLWVYQSPLYYRGYYRGVDRTPPARISHAPGAYNNPASDRNRGSGTGGHAGFSGSGRSPASAGFHGGFGGGSFGGGGFHGGGFGGHR